MMRWFNGYQSSTGYGMMGGIGWLWMFIILVVVILLIVGIVYVLRGRQNLTNKSYRNVPNDRSLDILNERYAKGEITKEEYDVIKKTL